jgi:hypothetical protein
MVDTVILHAGPHKTGTTALQATLTAKAELLAQHGVLYPMTGRSANSHAPLGEALAKGDTSLLVDLAAEIRGWRVVLISTEHLSALDNPALAALRDLFPKAEFRLSYTLRRLVGLWPSHWAELVKHSQTLGFSGYLDRVEQRDDRPFHAPVLPRRQLDRLASVFGEASLRIGIHDARIAEGLDIGPAFIDDMLGLGQLAADFRTEIVNSSPPDLQTALTYLLNRHAGDHFDYPAKQQARLAMLSRLRDTSPPSWRQPLEHALNLAERLVLTQGHPLVVAEQEAVIAQYGPALQDPAETYLAPCETSVPLVETMRLDVELEATLAAEFDALLKAPGPAMSPA